MSPAAMDPSLASHLRRIDAYARGARLCDPSLERPDMRRALAAFLVYRGPEVLDAWLHDIGPALGIPPADWPGIKGDQQAALQRWAKHIEDPDNRETYLLLHRHTRSGFIAQFPASRFLSAQMRLVRLLDAALRREYANDTKRADALSALLAQEFQVRVLHITDFFVEGREERLLQQEAAYQRAIEYAPSCVIMADAADGRIFLANRSAVRLFGWERSEFEGRELLDLVVPAERARGEALLREAEAAGHATRDGLLLRTRSGTVRAIATIGYLDYGDRRWMQLMCTDVSERDRLETQLVQSEKMAAIGALAAGIAHELRNPLAIVMNALYDLRQLLASASSAVLEDLVIAEEEIGRAQAIIKNLLEFSRESGAEIERVDANDIVAKTLQLMGKSLHNAGVRVTADLGPLPPCVANANALRQIVLNLVTNAVQAMPQGGDLLLRTAPSPDGNRIQLQVQDTGVGIPAAHLRDIFNPFYTTKAPGQGTGLGLSVVHSILQRYRGEIRVESQVGVGTTFTIELPCPCHDDAAAPSDGRAA